jgi:hypothetical protein
MDMNQLFQQHQIALIAAQRARRDGSRGTGFALPDHYAQRIDDYRARRGMDAYFAGRARRECKPV